MSLPFADLHLHSHYSDGSDAPAHVVERAAALGVGALALTDHDTVEGVGEARDACAKHGIAYLPGTEISALFRHAEVHIVGLGIDPVCPGLLLGLAKQQAKRAERAMEITAKLARRGIRIDEAALAARAPGGLVGRMHIAALLHEQGHARTVQEGFDRFLNRNRPAWVPKCMVTPEEAIGWIHAAGGLAFLAHPGIGKRTNEQLDALMQLPFDGIEAYHIHHSPGVTARFLELAETRGMLIAGGSDCHGTVKGLAPGMGKVRVPMRHFDAIVARLRTIRA